ncbi:MAG: hypothetical protein ABIS59_02365 [Candidatus Saccharibacteria bacterium]
MAHPTNNFSVHRFLGRRKTKTAVDRMAYVIGIGGNIAVVPQIIKSWTSDAPGLAISTWIMFTGFGFIWLIYAIEHKQKPLIVAQLVGMTCNLLVVLGWVVNHMFS